MTIWRNGKLIEEEPLCVPPRNVQGVLTTSGCEGGRVFLWPRHRSRLLSFNGFVIDAATLPTQHDLEKALHASRCLGSARVRVSVWREPGSDTVNVEAVCFPVERFGYEHEPVWLAIVRWRTPPDPEHKIIDRRLWQDAGDQAVSWGADDALLADADGRILETSKANIFVRRGSVVATPPAPDRCLPGIMRGVLIEGLPSAGLKVEERDVYLDELSFADEVWVTNAVVGAVRVGRVGERRWDRWDFHERLAAMPIPAAGWPR